MLLHRTARPALIGLAALVALGAFTTHALAESKKLWSFKPKNGFVGGSMAFDGDQQHFAYIHTDSAAFLKIIVMKTAGFKKLHEIKLPDPAMVPRGLYFTTDSKGLIFVWQNASNSTYSALLYELDNIKKRPKSVGPADFVQVTAVDGKQTVTTTQVKEVKTRGGKLYKVTAHRADSFRKSGEGRTYVSRSLEMSHGRTAIRIYYWEPGHVSLMGLKEGRYDKRRDVRLPRKNVRYDLLQRKVTWSKRAKDLVDWTKATNMRPNHPFQYRFLEVDSTYTDLQYVGKNNEYGTVKLPIKWKLYEPKSLQQHESWDGKTLHFSMTIDPVNPIAVKRKKADPERCDLYRLDPGKKAVLLGQVLTRKRGFLWAAGKKYFAYLYKLKGFGEGGVELALFKVGTK